MDAPVRPAYWICYAPVMYDFSISGVIWILCTPCLGFCVHVVRCLPAQREEDTSRKLLENGSTAFSPLIMKRSQRPGLPFLICGRKESKEASFQLCKFENSS